MRYTELDFTEAQWDMLCVARMQYVAGRSRSGWYRLLRAWCAYTTGSPIKQDMEILVDRWLLAHPSWAQRYKEGVV